MRLLSSLLVGLILIESAATATEPSSSPSRTSSYEVLASFGEHVEALMSFKDNVFLYADERNRLEREAAVFTDTLIEFSVRVKKVTETEVQVEVSDAGRTRVVLRHTEPPYFGNLRTVSYVGPKSTELSDLFSKPVGLRVGTEIDLELARRLRKDDEVLLRGRLKSVNAYTESIFNPLAIAVIHQFEVVSND